MSTPIQPLGKLLILIGLVCIIAGILLVFFQKLPFLGKMPGDIIIQKKSFTFYFPIVTSIILSIVLTLIFYIIQKLK